MNKPNHRSVSLYDVLEIYDAYDFPALLGGLTNSIAMGILRKWNKLRRPKTFRMSNKELTKWSGVDSHWERHRNKIIEICIIEETTLISYRSRGRSRAGIYTIDTSKISDQSDLDNSLPVTDPLPSDYQPITDPLPKSAEFGDDLRGEKNREKTEEEEVVKPLSSSNKTRPRLKLPTSSSSPSKPSEPESDIVALINHLCATTWSPQRDIDADNLRELCDYPDETARWALKQSLESKPTIRPPGIVTYALGVIRHYNEENQGDIQEKQGDGVLAEGVKELQDSQYWMEVAIRGHRHGDIAYEIHVMAALTEESVKQIFFTYVPQSDDNYLSLDEYRKIYEEERNESAQTRSPNTPVNSPGYSAEDSQR